MSKEILVLGAGVSGLSCGILLLKKGYKVKIWAKDLPPNTTSNKAAAAWYPYLSAPIDKVSKWSKTTYDYFFKEFVGKEGTGCINKQIIEVFDKEESDDPAWKGSVSMFKRPDKDQLPEGYVDGYEIAGLVIDTSLYMEYLVKLFKDLGGELIRKDIKKVDEALVNYDIVVNCTGLGSKDLFNDHSLFPVRGQMVKVKLKKLTVDRVTVDDSGHNSLSIIAPRVSDIMLGGTTQINDWNLEVNPEDTKEILRKCALLDPNLKEVEIISESVGLRPARSEIRLEAEKIGGKVIIHNYGHGGSGFTLSWGCAQNVAEIIEKLPS